MEDFATNLAFEIKKEIADRYFGFRKIIEEDSSNYQQEIIDAAIALEKDIGFDLLRIYTLLQDDQLIKEFYQLTKLGDVLFFDSYVSESPTIRKRLLAEQPVHGFFRKSRFRNMFFAIYKTLRDHINDYRIRIADLAEDHEVIAEEIDLFYRKNDISGIMLFLRDLDGGGTTSGPMSGGITSNSGVDMEQKMRVHPPEPVEKILPVLPQLPERDSIKAELTALANRACKLHPDFDVKNL